MKLVWERASRLPRPPTWAVVLVCFWLILVLGGVLLEQRGASPMDTCLLHRLTGHPCPTCGSTRVLMGLGRGAWLEAFRFNPLVALGVLSTSLWLGIRLLTSGQPRLDLSPRERQAALLLGLGLLLVNWVWVLQTQGP